MLEMDVLFMAFISCRRRFLLCMFMVETGLPISVEEGLTLTGLKPLEEVITLLCFKCIFKIPFLFTTVKEDGDCSSAAPADRPGAPDTDRTEHLCKDDG